MTFRLAAPRLFSVPGGVVIRMEPLAASGPASRRDAADEDPALLARLARLFQGEIAYRPTCPDCPRRLARV